MNFSFWRKWLLAASLYHVVFGLMLAFFGQSALMDLLLNQYFDPIFWPDGQISAGTMQYKGWVMSVLGAVTVSWSLLIAFIAYYPFKSREQWAWSGLAVAVSFWFVIDTGCSLYYRVPVNAFFNLFTLLLFAVPLMFTWKYFFGRAE